MTINILIVGSAAREHIITEKLYDSPQPKAIFCYASHENPGIKTLCKELVTGDLQDTQMITQYAKEKAIDFAFIGPEAPLEVGLADSLQAAGIPCIGPNKALAQIETSKSFARELLSKESVEGIPYFKTFESMDGIAQALAALGEDYVIKADGLMGGKGVKLSGEHLHSHQQALDYCQQIFDKQQTVVIEEKLIGEEFSLLSFVDGQHLVHMPIIQDHKRAFNNDTGPNTGGMGTYSFADHKLPFVTEDDITAARKISEHSIRVLQSHCEQRYHGILYGSFMVTANGIKLIEYNARFGDPEILNLLTLIDCDFINVCQQIINGTLDEDSIHFKQAATVCKYLVPKGYPDKPQKNIPIIPAPSLENIHCYYGAVIANEEQLLMTGSRAIALVATAQDTQQASDLLEEYIQYCEGDFFHRNDIGQYELINQRIKQINQVCDRDLLLL